MNMKFSLGGHVDRYWQMGFSRKIHLLDIGIRPIIMDEELYKIIFKIIFLNDKSSIQDHLVVPPSPLQC